MVFSFFMSNFEIIFNKQATENFADTPGMLVRKIFWPEFPENSNRNILIPYFQGNLNRKKANV